MTVRRVLLAGLAGWVLFAGVASAQLTSAQQKCIDNYNNKLRLVSQQAGKSATACMKSATAGDELNVEACVVSNPDGKIASKEDKVAALFGPDTICDPVPLVIVKGAAIGNASHVSSVSLMMHRFFGNPMGVISTDKTDAKCLNTAVQRTTQALTEIVKQHRACKKAGLKSGTVTSNATLLATCGTFALLDGAGKADARLQKLDADVLNACAKPGIDLASLFDGLPGTCHGTAAALSTCLRATTRCRACYALNNADTQAMNCDLFDDGAANGSCLS
jgi:hypothetical protein